MTFKKYRTAECVTPKHPDKICDTISDAILDHCLSIDPYSRVAVETCGGHGHVHVTGEITTNAFLPIEEIVQEVYGKEIKVTTNVVKQSNEIAQGVDIGGAGDQGIMVGYACDHNPEMVPNETYLARQICKEIYKAYPYDGKTQVTLENNQVRTVVASFQNAPAKELKRIINGWMRTIQFNTDNVTLHCNPAGDWSVGGFDADAGLTGRKIVIDNYGPAIPVGGGAFSGKDPTKVDRSAAYMARKIAVDHLQLLSKRSEGNEIYVYLAYAIGYDQPVQATMIVNGEEKLVTGYDLSPNGIIEHLDLRKPKYIQTARWGHMGTDQTWG
jgi:S-adenosylmethionine synthetase